MQVTETEIILPFKIERNRSFSKRNLVPLCLIGFLLLSAGVFFLIPHKGLIPTTGEEPLAIFLIVLAIMFLLPSISALAIMLRGESSRAPRFVRIDHEGIFFSHLLPVVVKWSEISTLVPYTWTYLGSYHADLGIIPLNSEAIIDYIVENRSKNFLSMILSKINLYLFSRSNALTPLNIPQVFLPITIDELITMIQERFADELSESHITVLGWQVVTG